MKVCHFSTGAIAAPYFENMTRGLAREGISVLLVSLRPEAKPPWLHEAAGSSFVSLGSRSRLEDAAAAWRLMRLLRQESVDILQTHLYDAGLVGSVASRLGSVASTVLTRHHLDQVEMAGSPLHVALDRWMARSADTIVAVSDAVRQHLQLRDRIPTPIEVIHIGFDFERLQASDSDRIRLRTELSLGEGFVVGCISHFFPTKGHAYLIAAAAALSREIPELKLLFVGDGERSVVEALAVEHGIRDRVVFAGHRGDVPACLKAMDLVVHPSLSEAFSQVIIETLALGRALVTTDVGGAREVVRDRETGVLVPPGDSNAIARAVRELYLDRVFRERLQDAARPSVVSRFTVDRMVRSQIDCYEALLEQRRN